MRTFCVVCLVVFGCSSEKISVNRPPSIVGTYSHNIESNAVAEGFLTVSDPDGDPVTVQVLTFPVNGVFAFDPNASREYAYVYQAPSVRGDDSLQVSAVVQASDGKSISLPKSIFFNVSGDRVFDKIHRTVVGTVKYQKPSYACDNTQKCMLNFANNVSLNPASHVKMEWYVNNGFNPYKIVKTDQSGAYRVHMNDIPVVPGSNTVLVSVKVCAEQSTSNGISRCGDADTGLKERPLIRVMDVSENTVVHNVGSFNVFSSRVLNEVLTRNVIVPHGFVSGSFPNESTRKSGAFSSLDTFQKTYNFLAQHADGFSDVAIHDAIELHWDVESGSTEVVFDSSGSHISHVRIAANQQLNTDDFDDVLLGHYAMHAYTPYLIQSGKMRDDFLGVEKHVFAPNNLVSPSTSWHEGVALALSASALSDTFYADTKVVNALSPSSYSWNIEDQANVVQNGAGGFSSQLVAALVHDSIDSANEGNDQISTAPVYFFGNVVGGTYFKTSGPLSSVYTYSAALRKFRNPSLPKNDDTVWDRMLVDAGFLPRNAFTKAHEDIGAMQNTVRSYTPVYRIPMFDNSNSISSVLNGQDDVLSMRYMLFCNNGVSPLMVSFNGVVSLSNAGAQISNGLVLMGYSNGVKQFEFLYNIPASPGNVQRTQILTLQGMSCGTVVCKHLQSVSNSSYEVTIHRSSGVFIRPPSD